MAACFAVAIASTVTDGGRPAAATSVCPTAASFTSGSGSAGDPYVIATPENLQYLRETPAIWDDGLFFSFTSDIDMTGCEWTGGLGQTSLNIGGLKATIDGNGHVVSGISIVSDASAVGFIAQHTEGSVEDLGVQGAITVNTTATGSVSSNVGGLIGASYSNGTIRRSFADVDIAVTVYVSEACTFECRSSLQAYYGGLLGYSSSATVSDSYARGDLVASASATSGPSSTGFIMLNMGGLLGAIFQPVSRSYSTGSVTGSAVAPSASSRIGGFIGYSNVTAPSSFWDSTTSGTSTGIGLAPGAPSPQPTGKATTDMKSLSTYSGSWSIASTYDAAKTWILCPSVNSGYPALMAMQSPDTCAPPDLISISPGSGSSSGGTAITVTGTALSGATSVTIGGTPATITANTATSITATTPPGTAGTRDVVVTTADGSDTLAGAFTYLDPPEATTISPASGSTAGGAFAIITGSALSGAASVTIGGTPATITANTATSITATTPPGTAGTRDVVVTTAGGSDTLAGAFTYLPPRIPSGGGGSSGAGTTSAIPPSTSSLPTSASAPSAGAPSSTAATSSANPPAVLVAAALNRAHVFFPYRSHVLSARAKAALDSLLARVPSASTAMVRASVAGTTRGKVHQRLALARARAVVEYLRQSGIQASVAHSLPAPLRSSSARSVEVNVR